MKIVLILVSLAFLVLVSARSYSSDDQFSWHHSRQHKTDHSRWSPFKREDDSPTNDGDDETVGNSSSSVNSTESTVSLENNVVNASSDFYRSRHESYSPSLPSSPSAPIARIDWGTIEGTIETYADSNVSVFYGIPYAEPPVGKLRFRLPVKLEGRHRGIYNATTPKPACMQSQTGTPVGEPVSEDCLTINIWVPREEEDEEKPSSSWSRRARRSTSSHHHEGGFLNSRWWSSSPSHDRSHSSHGPERSRHRSSEHRRYPVLFYVYGSQFKKHSSTLNMNRGGVTAAIGKMIFVSFNYRLQSFGFAYGGDRHMPGNQALYDCLAALEWTRKNIAAFGGDPDKITLAGSSAGSELAAMLALSPSVSPFLFDQVVLMSAVPMRPASIEPTSIAINKTKALAAKLGCGEFSSHDFRLSYEQLDCLQAANATDIAEADTSDDITVLGSCPDFAFMPIYGDDFMPTPPEVILNKKQARRNMKYMAGSDHFGDVETGEYQPASRAEAEEHLNTMFTNMIKPRHNISRDLSHLYDYYFNGVSDNDTWTLKERLGQLIGDNMFDCPLLLFLEKWAEIDPVHYYYFNYTCDAHRNSGQIKYQHAPGHGDANFMFLGRPFKVDTFSDRDRQVSRKMIQILADFVHKGEIAWPPMLVSRRNKVLPLEWVIDEHVDIHNMKVSPKMDICRYIAKLYHVYF